MIKRQDQIEKSLFSFQETPITVERTAKETPLYLAGAELSKSVEFRLVDSPENIIKAFLQSK